MELELGFETIGNATVICHDRRPIIVTDPWFEGPAYFGSWTLSHEIPEQQCRAILGCEYVWCSHGHPDHLSGASLELLKGKKILIPNHFGNRIHDDLKGQGYDVHVLVDRQWTQLSERIRVMCVPDYNQDAVLLIDVGGTLVLNTNDAGDRGWGAFVRSQVRQFKKTYLLALSGFGDADMMNYFTEDGQRITPYGVARTPIGPRVARLAEYFGARYFVPFSSLHKYQRADSVWANVCSAHVDDYAKGFDSKRAEVTPAFIQHDVLRDRTEEIRPAEKRIVPVDPKEFGDDWSEPLTAEDRTALTQYFKGVEHLGGVLDYLNFRVGGQDHVVAFNDRRFDKGLTFEAPRNSLMQAVQWQIFDDLLIGNFAKVTLHGDWGPMKLYPDFTPYVAKYADNGRARTKNELGSYFAHYRSADPLGYFRHKVDAQCLRPLQEGAAVFLRQRIGANSPVFQTARRAFWAVKRVL